MFKNKKFGLLLIVALLVVPMVLVACGDDDKDDNGGGDLNLNQTIEGNNGLSAKYPEGWAAQADDDGSLQIANSADMLERVGGDETLKDDEFGVMVMALPLGEAGDMGAREAFDMMAVSLASEGSGGGEVKEIKIGDKDGYRVDASPVDGTDGIILGFESNGALVVVIGVSADGKIGDYEDATLKIAETVEYSAP